MDILDGGAAAQQPALRDPRHRRPGHAAARQRPGDHAPDDGPDPLPLRGLYPSRRAARPARRAGARREEAEAASTDLDPFDDPTTTECSSTSEAPAAAVKIVYITLAFLMGGGLVLFGIGGGGASRRPRGRDHRAAPAATPAPTASEAGEAAAAKAPRQPDRRRGLGRARPRAVQPRQHGREHRPEHRQLHRRRRRAAARRRPGLGRARQLADKQARTRASPSLMVQAYAGLGELDKATAAQEIIALDRNSAGAYATLATARLPGRPDPQGRPRRRQGARADGAGQARAAQGRARAAKHAGALQAAQEDAATATPTPTDDAGEVALGAIRRPALVAQLAEQRTLNPKVEGSIPSGGTL